MAWQQLILLVTLGTLSDIVSSQTCPAGCPNVSGDTCCLQPDSSWFCCGSPGKLCCYGAKLCCNADEVCYGNPPACHPRTPDKCAQAGNTCDKSTQTCCGTQCCPIANAQCCLKADHSGFADGLCCPGGTECAAAGGCQTNKCKLAGIACNPSDGICCGDPTASPSTLGCCKAVGGICCVTGTPPTESGNCCPPDTVCDGQGGCKTTRYGSLGSASFIAQIRGTPSA